MVEVFCSFMMLIYSVSFLSKLIRTGGKRPLVEEDLGSIGRKMKMSVLYAKLDKEWEKECKKKPEKRSFVSAMIRASGIGRWTLFIILNLISICLSFVPTIILNLLVSDLENDEPGKLFLLISDHRLSNALGIYHHSFDCSLFECSYQLMCSNDCCEDCYFS